MGVLIVLGALYVSTQSVASVEGQESAVVSASPTRASLETKDSDGDGIPDWEESLTKGISAKIIASSTAAHTAGEPYVPPTTLTGKFSEAFLKDYLEGKMRGEDFSDPSRFVESAIAAIDTSTQSKRHTRAELSLIPATGESLRTYGNELVSIMDRNAHRSDSEMIIVEKALEAEDATLLEQLEPLEKAYRNTLTETLRMSVPDTLAKEHVDLLNAYEAILLDIIAMQEVFTDPLYGIARMRAYERDVDSLTNALRSIGSILDAGGIRYAGDEPGKFFYIFDAL